MRNLLISHVWFTFLHFFHHIQSYFMILFFTNLISKVANLWVFGGQLPKKHGKKAQILGAIMVGFVWFEKTMSSNAQISVKNSNSVIVFNISIILWQILIQFCAKVAVRVLPDFLLLLPREGLGGLPRRSAPSRSLRLSRKINITTRVHARFINQLLIIWCSTSICLANPSFWCVSYKITAIKPVE